MSKKGFIFILYQLFIKDYDQKIFCNTILDYSKNKKPINASFFHINFELLRHFELYINVLQIKY